MEPDVAFAALLAGRFMLGGYFVVSGIRNVPNIDTHANILASCSIPQPRAAAIAGVVLMIVSGASVALSLWPALGAIGLLVFTLVATAIYHHFWSMTGKERVSHFGSFLSNGALTGALLVVLATA